MSLPTLTGSKVIPPCRIKQHLNKLETIYFSGIVDKNLDLTFEGDVDFKGGCAVTLRDQMWYLGGDKQQVNFAYIVKNQITHS